MKQLTIEILEELIKVPLEDLKITNKKNRLPSCKKLRLNIVQLLNISSPIMLRNVSKQELIILNYKVTKLLSNQPQNTH